MARTTRESRETMVSCRAQVAPRITRTSYHGQPTSSCTPGGRPSVWHDPCSSTSSTRSGAPHLALRWSSMRYFCFTLRVHRRLGLYWHSTQLMSPQPVDLVRRGAVW